MYKGKIMSHFYQKTIQNIIQSEIYFAVPVEVLNSLKRCETENWTDFHERGQWQFQEYYFVSNWFGDKLMKHNETIWELSNAMIWGRKKTGELVDDEIIQMIVIRG